MRDRQQRRYEWPLRLAKASLLWERLWPRLWPILGVVGAFTAIALLDVLPALPPALHALVLFVLVAALAVALRNAAIGLQPVRRREARHRLERDSGLSHRPLTALEDDLLAGRGDPAAQVLWSRHVKQMAAAAGRLRVRLPAPGMAGIEPHGLRVIVVLALIIGLVAAGDHAGARLKRAVTPHLAVPPVAPVAIDIWVTPPAYTGMAPLFLRVPDAAEAEVTRIPAGSVVLAQVYGLAAPPRLLVGSEMSDFASLGTAEGGTGYRAEVEIHKGDRLAIRAGRRTLASWPVEVVPDQAPEVQVTARPDATSDGSLRIGYEAADDYGITALTAVIHHGEDNSEGEDGVRVSMPLASPGASAVEGRSQHDLTFHRWAGSEVSIRLEAEDAAGQTGLSSAVSVVLPERPFSHPVARAVIEQRKRLIDENVPTRESVASRLGAIGARPERFSRDVVVSLALAVARSRLLYDENAQAVASVRSILWDTALRIEQGTLPEAEQRLSEARDRLQEALRSDLGSDEIDVLADELQHALDAYLEALANELARQGVTGSPPIPMSQSVHAQDLRDIVDMARQLAAAGARDRARDLLAELQQLLDSVRSSFNAGIQAAEELAEAGRLLSELEDLTRRQEDLLDSTFGALHRSGTDDVPERSGPSPLDSEPAAGAAAEQNALRRALDTLMGRIDDLVGRVPASLGEAGHAMGDAAAALRAQHLAAAVSDQTRAVEKLRVAAEASARMMAEQLSGAGGMLVTRPGGNPWGRGDPFGRFGTEGLRGLGIGDVDIPDGAQMRYVEEIVRELRRRAGDSQRPQLERDYIERLLRRF